MTFGGDAPSDHAPGPAIRDYREESCRRCFGRNGWNGGWNGRRPLRPRGPRPPRLGWMQLCRPRPEGAALAASYLPLEVGAVWRYAITRDDGRRGEGVVSVDGVDYGGSNGGVAEYRIREELLDGTIWSWEGREAKRVALEQEEIDDRAGNVLDEESYDPPITVVDERAERLAVGAKWPEAFINTTPNAKGHPKSKRAEAKWEVESVTDQVSVPAGTFTCLRLPARAETSSAAHLLVRQRRRAGEATGRGTARRSDAGAGGGPPAVTPRGADARAMSTPAGERSCRQVRKRPARFVRTGHG